jgi:hypothetical protein
LIQSDYLSTRGTNTVKKLLSLVAALSLTCGMGLAHAAEGKKPLTPQQQKMATCNKEATGKKGADRKAFMKECLSAKKTAAAPAPAVTAKAAQQEKMKTCNKEATGKKGKDRKAFMKECLSKA